MNSFLLHFMIFRIILFILYSYFWSFLPRKFLQFFSFHKVNNPQLKLVFLIWCFFLWLHICHINGRSFHHRRWQLPNSQTYTFCPIIIGLQKYQYHKLWQLPNPANYFNKEPPKQIQNRIETRMARAEQEWQLP